LGWEELGGDGGVEELVGEDEEGGGDKIPPSTGGTATGEAFGEGLVEAITAQIFPQKQNALAKHFHHPNIPNSYPFQKQIPDQAPT